jgi:queuine tRNA-ribosyltransferase
VETPFFMPVGTYGSVKTVGWEDLEALGYEQVLSNTYHLMLRPGAPLVERLGGLHTYTGWNRSILTDSGGYQVMSLAQHRRLDDEKVVFKSHLDGSLHELTPERSIQLQAQLGVDISMSLDHCAPYPVSREGAEEAMRRTHLWAPRNLAARREGQAVFGIVQGGIHLDLRTESAEFFRELPFDGFAIGGVSVGEPTELQYPVVRHTAPLLPADKARYLMGVGHPADILHAVSCGIDMFDCVLPTRMARHSVLYTMRGRCNASAARFAEQVEPHDRDSVFPMTERYSPAYLRHLLKAGEPTGARIATLHNLAFYARLMEEIRRAIVEGTWPQLMERYACA